MRKLFAAVVLALFTLPVLAALYNIIGTDDYVNGVPPSLTKAERAKLATVTISKTDAAIEAGKYNALSRAQAKAKVKQLLADEAAQILVPPPPEVAPPPPPPVIVPPPSEPDLRPAVDRTKLMTPMIGATDLRIQPTTQVPASTKDGAFRIECFPSHMSFDDPLIYPNKPGASPLGVYFGNTSVNAFSDVAALATTGNGTCKGGRMNLSSYRTPAMIDTATGAPIVPEKAIFYYKSGGLMPGSMVPPPKGLRFITGNPNAKTEAESSAMFTCVRPSGQPFYGWKKSIPACVVGETMQMMIKFPQCWDGKNLDSANHMSHMAHTLPQGKGCPATHPVGIPQVTLALNWVITSENRTANWRLSTDNYDPKIPAGYSASGDWINGWDEKIIEAFVKNCVNGSKDCSAHLIGDGRMFYKGTLK